MLTIKPYISMDTSNPYIFHDEKSRPIILISAFYDINRSTWKNSARSTENYLQSFRHYMNTDYKMIVFLDERYMGEDFVRNTATKQFIPITMDWMKTHLRSWQQYDRVKEIMESEDYHDLLGERIRRGAPENCHPDYTIINHAKIDFIHYAITHNLIAEKDAIICWSDFGIHQSIYHCNVHEFPTPRLDPRKINLDAWNFCLRNPVQPTDFDPVRTVLEARETFTGGFFAATAANMIELHELYHQCLDELYDMLLSDDDQHVYLRCYEKAPQKFQLFLSPHTWPKGLTYFAED